MNIRISDLNLCKVDALKRCIDLCNDGYVEKFSTYTNGHIFVRLEHQRNGKVIFFRAYEDRYTLTYKGEEKPFLECFPNGNSY